MRITPRRPDNRLSPATREQRLLETTTQPNFALGTASFATANPLEALEHWRLAEEGVQNPSVRWRPEAFPLKVWIEPHESLESLVLHTFREWEAVGAAQIRFVSCALSGVEDIRVFWTEEATVGRDYEVGHTRREVRGRGWITRADVTLLKTPLIDATLNAEQRLQRLRTTVLHEAGHALGLEHSEHKGDIMHHRGWRNTRISPRDAQKLQELYSQTPTIQWI